MTEYCPHCEETFDGKFAEKRLKSHKRNEHELNFSTDERPYYVQ